MAPIKEERTMTTDARGRWLQRGLLAGACLLLAACAPMNHKALSAEAQSRIRDVHVQVVLPQEGFTFSAASPNVSAALGGGLIGALIDSSVQKSRQDGMRGQVQPVLDQLLEADFRAEARAVLAQAASDFPLKIARAEVVPVMPSAKEQERIIASEPPQGAYLQVNMQYAYNFDSRVLTTRSAVSLWQNGQKDAAFLGACIYQGAPLPAESAALLPAVRAQMRDAVAHTLQLAALDIRQPAAQGSAPRQPFTFKAATGASVPLQGEVLATADKYRFMRTADGALFSVAR
jgi:hypothetical protein